MLQFAVRADGALSNDVAAADIHVALQMHALPTVTVPAQCPPRLLTALMYAAGMKPIADLKPQEVQDASLEGPVIPLDRPRPMQKLQASRPEPSPGCNAEKSQASSKPCISIRVGCGNQRHTSINSSPFAKTQGPRKLLSCFKEVKGDEGRRGLPSRRNLVPGGRFEASIQPYEVESYLEPARSYIEPGIRCMKEPGVLQPGRPGPGPTLLRAAALTIMRPDFATLVNAALDLEEVHASLWTVMRTILMNPLSRSALIAAEELGSTTLCASQQAASLADAGSRPNSNQSSEAALGHCSSPPCANPAGSTSTHGIQMTASAALRAKAVATMMANLKALNGGQDAQPKIAGLANGVLAEMEHMDMPLMAVKNSKPTPQTISVVCRERSKRATSILRALTAGLEVESVRELQHKMSQDALRSLQASAERCPAGISNQAQKGAQQYLAAAGKQARVHVSARAHGLPHNLPPAVDMHQARRGLVSLGLVCQDPFHHPPKRSKQLPHWQHQQQSAVLADRCKIESHSPAPRMKSVSQQVYSQFEQSWNEGLSCTAAAAPASSSCSQQLQARSTWVPFSPNETHRACLARIASPRQALQEPWASQAQDGPCRTDAWEAFMSTPDFQPQPLTTADPTPIKMQASSDDPSADTEWDAIDLDDILDHALLRLEPTPESTAAAQPAVKRNKRKLCMLPKIEEEPEEETRAEQSAGQQRVQKLKESDICDQKPPQQKPEVTAAVAVGMEHDDTVCFPETCLYQVRRYTDRSLALLSEEIAGVAEMLWIGP